MFDLKKLVRPNIRKLKPYHSARDDFEKGLLLDANENSQGPPAKELKGLHRYPSPSQRVLRGKIANFRQVQPQNIFIGAGSDEAIDLLFRIFCEPGKDRIITTPPTYGMYHVSADIHNIKVDEVVLDDNFQPRVDAILEKINQHTKILFLCSPNNPTANLFDRSKVDQLIKKFPGIIVIDEAYIDFAEQESYANRVHEQQNLVVLQTMSKSFGLAGIRLGIAIAFKSIIQYMMKVKAPYNINALTSRAALEAFEHTDTIIQNIQSIKNERKRLCRKLADLPHVNHIFKSDANFLLVKMNADARKIYDHLTSQGIIVRYRGDEPGCANCLRITVGTKDENNQLVGALRTIPLPF